MAQDEWQRTESEVGRRKAVEVDKRKGREQRRRGKSAKKGCGNEGGNKRGRKERVVQKKGRKHLTRRGRREGLQKWIRQNGRESKTREKWAERGCGGS